METLDHFYPDGRGWGAFDCNVQEDLPFVDDLEKVRNCKVLFKFWKSSSQDFSILVLDPSLEQGILSSIPPGFTRERPVLNRLREAAGCVKYCDDNHFCILQDHAAAMPLRLPDLREMSGKNMIRLVECSKQRVKYIALSHRWGEANPTLTTFDCCASFYKGIQFEQLPKRLPLETRSQSPYI